MERWGLTISASLLVAVRAKYTQRTMSQDGAKTGAGDVFQGIGAQGEANVTKCSGWEGARSRRCDGFV